MNIKDLMFQCIYFMWVGILPVVVEGIRSLESRVMDNCVQNVGDEYLT